VAGRIFSWARFLTAVGVASVAAALVAGATAASPAKPAPKPFAPIVVFAGSSLTDAFPAIDARETYSFAGSNTLAAQIANGAPADIFASGNTTIPATLYAQGLVLKPVDFTRNTLVIVVPRANQAGISGIYDLTKPGVKIDIANHAVPVGSYTLTILKNMALTSRVLPNVVSQETDVRTVLTKVVLGQADAGFVYATDARAVPGEVKVIKVPAWAQPKVTYSMAVVSRSPNQAAAQAFIKRVLSKAGQAKMLAFGFVALPYPTPSAGVFQQ
jgi:molybdate transport system substrate-binding protein